MADTLYTRLGGYDAIAAVADHLVTRLAADGQPGRFGRNRGGDGVRRELIDFLCSPAGGPLSHVGRDTKMSHRGMRISEDDWQVFHGHAGATPDHFDVPGRERVDVHWRSSMARSATSWSSPPVPAARIFFELLQAQSRSLRG